MAKYLGWQIFVNNALFILTIPIAVFAGFVFGSADFIYGGMTEALFTEIILIVLFFIFLIVRISKVKNKEVKIIYSYSSCFTAYFVIIFILWQSFIWLDLFFKILDIALVVTTPYFLVFISEKTRIFWKKR